MRATERRLAAAGLADQPERLARLRSRARRRRRHAPSRAAPAEEAAPDREVFRGRLRDLGEWRRHRVRMQADRSDPPAARSSARQHARRTRRSRSGQRSRNAQPLGRWQQVGHLPGIAASAPAVDRRAAASSAAAPGVYGCSGRSKMRDGRRPLDDPAGVHDRDLVGLLGHHAEIVGDEQDGHAEAPRSAASRSRISAWIVTSSAVVGSSAISSRGSHEMPWRSSRAGACRRRAGADSRHAPAAGSGMPTSLEQLDRPLPARRAGRARGAGARASAIWLPTVSTGLSAVIGSWKIIARPVAAHAAHLALGQRQQVAALEQHRVRPRCGPPAAPGASAQSAVMLLPQPDSPTSPSTRPGCRARTTRRRRPGPAPASSSKCMARSCTSSSAPSVRLSGHVERQDP